MPLNRNIFALAALSPSKGGPYTPVQLQKLFFLLDRNVGREVNGPHFHFEPYDYGPFDREVYQVLELLQLDNTVKVLDVPGRSWKQYKLTEAGQRVGEQALAHLREPVKSYIEAVSKYVQSLSFSELVSAIYKAYPDMKVNSVFNR